MTLYERFIWFVVRYVLPTRWLGTGADFHCRKKTCERSNRLTRKAGWPRRVLLRTYKSAWRNAKAQRFYDDCRRKDRLA